MNESAFYGVIMAGGRGTRFWPVSTRGLPKQFLRLCGERTMLQATADRFEGLCPRERIMVVTGDLHAATVMEQLPWLRRENLLLEPSGRNTAPCIGWAAMTLLRRGEDSAMMAVVPSDHVIDSPEGFRATMSRAAGPAASGSLVTAGIRPDRPATGYGYIETGEPIVEGVMRVLSFREKPDRKTASEYIETGRYLWNAGMFVWRADVIADRIREYLPDLARGLSGLGPGPRPDPGAYAALPAVSIDCGVMEKANDVAVVPALFDWNDIGDWPSARRSGVGRGEVAAFDSHSCTVWNEDRLTVLLGVENISVVETDSVTLVMSDRCAQELGRVVAEMEKKRPELV